jgi:hypothetical protein
MKKRKPTENYILWTIINYLCYGPGIEDFVAMGVPGQFRRPGRATRMKVGGKVV